MKRESFERALHRWKPWLTSIDEGRKVLRLPGYNPSLAEMRKFAQKTLTNLGFARCTLLELYWLCCIFADYQTKGGFNFEKIILPVWFPLPFGFENEENLLVKPPAPSTYQRKARWESFLQKNRFMRPGRRILPPQVWDEADRKFWFDRDPLTQILRPEDRKESFHDYAPNKDFTLLLSADHPVRKKVKTGRPITDKADGEAILE